MTHYSGYDQEELTSVVDLVMDNLVKPTKYDAIFKKYSSRKFMKASIFVKDWIEKHSPHSTSENGVDDEEEERSVDDEEEEEDQDQE